MCTTEHGIRPSDGGRRPLGGVRSSVWTTLPDRLILLGCAEPSARAAAVLGQREVECDSVSTCPSHTPIRDIMSIRGVIDGCRPKRVHGATITHMTTVASRDLRNHTADVLRQVADGTHVTVTINGRPVAEISPARSTRPQFFSKAEFAELVLDQADSALTDDLEKLAGETTADLDPL